MSHLGRVQDALEGVEEQKGHLEANTCPRESLYSRTMMEATRFSGKQASRAGVRKPATNIHSATHESVLTVRIWLRVAERPRTVRVANYPASSSHLLLLAFSEARRRFGAESLRAGTSEHGRSKNEQWHTLSGSWASRPLLFRSRETDNAIHCSYDMSPSTSKTTPEYDGSGHRILPGPDRTPTGAAQPRVSRPTFALEELWP